MQKSMRRAGTRPLAANLYRYGAKSMFGDELPDRRQLANSGPHLEGALEPDLEKGRFALSPSTEPVDLPPMHVERIHLRLMHQERSLRFG